MKIGGLPETEPFTNRYHVPCQTEHQARKQNTQESQKNASGFGFGFIAVSGLRFKPWNSS